MSLHCLSPSDAKTFATLRVIALFLVDLMLGALFSLSLSPSTFQFSFHDGHLRCLYLQASSGNYVVSEMALLVLVTAIGLVTLLLGITPRHWIDGIWRIGHIC